MKLKFLRRNTREYSRLGRKRKKLQKWRRPKGRDNKMRLKERGRPRVVEIGYKKKQKKKIAIVTSVEEVVKLVGYDSIVLGKIGKKKKIEIAKIAKEKNIEISNLNIDKFLKQVEKEREEREEKKKSSVKKKDKSNSSIKKSKDTSVKDDNKAGSQESGESKK